MDGDRKYRQNGYQDSGREHGPRQDKPKQPGPKLPLDITGPRLPRLVQNVVAARCFACGTALAQDTDFKSNCPKCHTALHCCKQCAHFEPSTRFQCLKPIPLRIPLKDQANECNFFSARVTVARDSQPAPAMGRNFASRNLTTIDMASRTPSDARAAFESLFKK